jgi:hypothetical protein
MRRTGALASVFTILVTLCACSGNDAAAEESQLEITVGITGCATEGDSCATLRVPGALVSLTQADNEILKGTTDEVGRSTFAVRLSGKVTVTATSTMLSRPITQDITLEETGGSTVVNLVDPLPAQLTRAN